LGLLCACGAAPAEPDPAALPTLRAETCLPQVWQSQDSPDEAFDVAHDKVEGGSISCATETTPSVYSAALRAIRAAAIKGDRAALARESAAKLLVIDALGGRRDLPGQDSSGEDVFTPDLLTLLSQVELSDMTVAPDGGGFFALGTVWLAPPEPGARPRIVTINLQALAEAKAAAS
jgi:hypothetical protein